MKGFIFFMLLFIGWQHLTAQQVYPLYDGQIPNVLDSLSDKDKPFITVHLPAKQVKNSAAIIILPGGGYRTLVTQTEGRPVAEAFAEKGIVAFVLHYRLPNDALMKDKHIVPLMDAQQAIRWVKLHHAEFNVDSARVGILGYSAGGHLAATLGTHFSASLVANSTYVCLRPAFMALVYPVVSMKTGLAHVGSRIALLGSSPSREQIRFFSAEQNVGKNTPPTYLVHAIADSVVSVNNSLVLFEALCKHGVSAELHLRSKGDHGFVHSFEVADWINPILSWLKREKFISSQY